MSVKIILLKKLVIHILKKDYLFSYLTSSLTGTFKIRPNIKGNDN